MKKMLINYSLVLGFILLFIFQMQVKAFGISNSVNNTSFNLVSSVFLSRIEGRVFDQSSNPISDINIELSDEVGVMIGRTKTDSTGRFYFSNVSRGRFTVKVLPFGRGFYPDTKEVEIAPIRNNSSDIGYVEFYLRPEKRNPEILEGEKPEVIFAQDIPEKAEELFEKGIKNLEKKNDQGISELEEAIKIFPNYFNALSRLGKEYILRKNYEKGYPYLLRAIDINSRSFSSYYSLGIAFYELKQIPAAVEAAKACLVIDSSSVLANLLYGILLRISGAYQESEKKLLAANSFSKGKNAEVHMQLALLYNRLNRNEDAIKELETYLKLEPKSPDKNSIQDTIAKMKASVSKNKPD